MDLGQSGSAKPRWGPEVQRHGEAACALGCPAYVLETRCITDMAEPPAGAQHVLAEL